MRVYRQSRVQFLTLALDGRYWPASRPCCFTPGKELMFHTRRLGGTQTRSGYFREEHTGNRTLGCPAHSLVTILTILSRLNNDLKGALKKLWDLRCTGLYLSDQRLYRRTQGFKRHGTKMRKKMD